MYDEIAAAGGAGLVTTGAALAYTGVPFGTLILTSALLSVTGALAVAGVARWTATKDR